jgi:CBS domain-containing protein
MKRKNAPLLGEIPVFKKSFSKIKSVFKELRTKDFKELIDRRKSERINRTLLELIDQEPEPCFLLAEVLDFVERVDREKLLHHYSFTSFELWLNQFSGLSFEENYRIRGKIAGKLVDRSSYQVLFPIGMGKVYEGSHFVTAHKSPDLDTTVASFWGWLDAFAARVGEALHIWNLPGGPPPSQIEIELIFKDIFGPAVFSHLAKTRTSLSVTANDLMTQKGLIRKTPADSITGIDHERDLNAVVVVDKQGFYLGDWRNFDVESVRQVIILLSSCMRWFENSLHLHLITLFAKEKPKFSQFAPVLEKLFSMKISHCEPSHEFTARQKKEVDNFLKHVIEIKQGVECSFEELGKKLAKLCKIPFEGLDVILDALKKSKLFDAKGQLLEKRPSIFSFLEKIVRELHKGLFTIREHLETFHIALKTKSEVFGHHPTYVTVRSDVEEIRNKMASYPYLTVAYPDHDKLYPVGIILAGDLRKNILGTVSLRDFCNREEMTIPSYLDVISIIDHHKSQLQTISPPMAIIADAQSSNSLVADRAFQINDRYSLRGQSLNDVDRQIEKIEKESTPHANRILRRLLLKRLAFEMRGSYFVHPDREFVEYLHFLYAILDDTDLLSKISSIDIECVVALLNRMKSLVCKEEVEIISLDDLSRDRNFLKKSAERILQNEEMYSLYRKVYEYRENEVERNIHLAAKGEKSNLFSDTKEQNGCCRVGQTKMFVKNVRLFERHADAIRKIWLKSAIEIHKDKPEIDLHIHMISTIVSAEEVYKGKERKYAHKDEMWIWIPNEENAIEHLKRFLNAFKSSPCMKDNSFSVEFLGSNGEELSSIFKESFFEIPQKQSEEKLPIAVLRFNAGSLNSRKSMVSPFLPVVAS